MIGHSAPLPTQTSSVAPIPTVVPTNPVLVHIHSAGIRTLWVVVVLMALSSICFYILAGRTAVQKRLFHVLTSLITTIAFLSYLAMATGDGVAWKRFQARESGDEILRQVFWARYINWGLTQPLTLINLAFLAGLDGASLLVAIAADLVMLTSGLTGTFSLYNRRWVWYTISCIGYLTLVYQIGINGRRAAANRDQQTQRFFGAITAATLAVLVLYPIILAASPLANRISLDAEAIVWAILDILTQGIFGYWLLLAHNSTETGSVYIDGFWSHGYVHRGTIRVGDEEGT